MGIHYFKIIDRKKWHQKQLLTSKLKKRTNSAAHTQPSCSTTIMSISPPRNSPKLSRPQETLSKHTGQCSSLRPSRPPTLVISSPKLPQLHQQEVLEVLDQPPLLPLPQKRQRRKKRKRMSIWEDSSVMKMITELRKIISHIKTI